MLSEWTLTRYGAAHGAAYPVRPSPSIAMLAIVSKHLAKSKHALRGTGPPTPQGKVRLP